MATNKKKLTNGDILRKIDVNLTQLDAQVVNIATRTDEKIDRMDAKIDSTNTRIDDLHTRFTDLDISMSLQFTNHLHTHHATLNKKLKIWGIVLSTGIVFGVFANNPREIVKIVHYIYKLLPLF